MSALFGRLFARLRGHRDEPPAPIPEFQRELEEFERFDTMSGQNPGARNVFISDLLKAYPVPIKNSNKVILPQSILKEITDKKVLDDRPRDKPLIFELTVADPETADVLEESHVGVDSFTAPPGRIGLPYKTALSLTKERGVGWLHENPLVSIRLIDVDSAPQSSMKVQPRGKGFFLEDETVVQLDIKTVLELTLQDHLVLTEGDWIPLFWDGNRFELVVKELQPNQIIDVLNTDLTVEMLQSEESEQSALEKENAQKRVMAFMEKREAREQMLTENYKNFKQANKADKGAISFRVRLPKGGNVTKVLDSSQDLSVLIDLIDIELYNKKFVPMHLPPEDATYFFNLVNSLPGKPKAVIETNKYHQTPISKVLAEKEVAGKNIVFSLEMIKEVTEEEEKEKSERIVHLNNEWLKMADRLESMLQSQEHEEIELMPKAEIEDLTAKLEAVGVDPELAAKVARLYGKQVNQLIGMGYEHALVPACSLLNEKRGNLEEVVNALLQ